MTFAEIKTASVSYKQGGVTFIGYVAYDDSIQGPRPGVLIFPEWWGLTDYPKSRALQLARLGYVAFAADLYGNGVTVDTAAEAGGLSTPLKQDIPTFRSRATAALEALKSQPNVDPKRIAAIGYCFGGTAALELARSGADLAAVVVFHAGLDTPNPADAKNIKARVLACVGGADKFCPPAAVDAFEKEMTDGNVDWEVNVYGGAEHAFTNPDADRHNLPNIKYDARADQRSFDAMKQLLGEVFDTTGAADQPMKGANGNPPPNAAGHG